MFRTLVGDARRGKKASWFSLRDELAVIVWMRERGWTQQIHAWVLSNRQAQHGRLSIHALALCRTYWQEDRDSIFEKAKCIVNVIGSWFGAPQAKPLT